MKTRVSTNIKQLFQLDPDIHFLNHGSFGACPKPVFDVYQEWQRELEKRPVEFLDRKFKSNMQVSREALGAYLNCSGEDLVYFTNPTTAINMLARSLDLNPGDQILTSDHEYGAMDRTWNYICGLSGAEYIHQPIPIPVSTHEDFVDSFWQGVTPRTKIIFISHITSQTALEFPVKEICRRAREQGILTIIDGAHAPGQIKVDLSDIGADFYTGACHKWLCAPKGSAFLYARREHQHRLDPLVVSWGYQAEQPGPSQFIDYHEWQGTRDISAFLTVPSAIQFQEDHQWESVRVQANQLVRQARSALNALSGKPPLSPEDQGWFRQMAAVGLPEVDIAALKSRLYTEYKVEVPVYYWNKRPMLRVSIQGYNNETDVQALLDGIGNLLPEL